jgi:hypothetical protein
MTTVPLMAAAALAVALGLSNGALAGPPGATLSAVQDVHRLEPAAMRGGRAQTNRRADVVPRIVVRPWVRPPWYQWAPGGAITAGAAGGVALGGAAARLGGRPPRPNMCWFFSAGRGREGFWDFCR